jgi:4-hydroxy-3-polyprenylbenzoate decarboxylase
VPPTSAAGNGRPAADARIIEVAASPKSLFVGISGASGAPYAVRLVEQLAQRGCSLSLCLSDTGVQVVRYELGLDAADRDAVTKAFLERARAEARVFLPDDLAAAASSGSSFPDAAVVCPCSMSSVAHIALGTGTTLIHRAGAVALKERRPLVLVPREVPLSTIHLRRLLEAAEAGAVIIPPAPAFYTRPVTLQDAVDYVVGKVLAALGFSHELFPAWGQDST